MTESEPVSNSFSFSMSVSWTDFFQKYKTYIIIGAIVVIALIILGIWWWNKKKAPSQESFKEEDSKKEPNSSKHTHSHDHHHHDHGDQPEKRPINEKNFESGKEKMKGTLNLIDKTIEDLKKIIHSIKQTKGKSSDEQEELTERLEDTLNFIKKMNEQAKKFGGFLLEDAHELKQYTPEFQAKVDGDVKSAQEKFERAVLLVQDLTKEMSSVETQPESEPTPESNE
jgi:FtsZ-interacting cell division protein ZipA